MTANAALARILKKYANFLFNQKPETL